MPVHRSNYLGYVFILLAKFALGEEDTLSRGEKIDTLKLSGYELPGTISQEEGLSIDLTKSNSTKIMELERTIGDTKVTLRFDPTSPDIYYDINLTTPKFGAPEEKKLPEEKELITEYDYSNQVIEYIYKAMRLYYMKNYDQALEEIQKSLNLKETALGYALEGTIYQALGEFEQARDSWQLALIIDPGLLEVQRVLEFLENQ